RVDHRDNNTVSAGIEDALDVFSRIPGYPGERHAIVARDERETVRRGFKIYGCMFQFDGEPVETDPGHQARRHPVRQCQPGADAGFASFQFGSSMILFHKGFFREWREWTRME